jgi:hypothetical protein
MIDLKFSYNWNHKLDCDAFTTIRIFNKLKHVPGTPVAIKLKEEDKGTGVIKDVRTFMLDNMNSFMAYIDTGYPLDEAKQVILRMYSKVDFKTTLLALILVAKDKVKQNAKKEQNELFV